VVVTNAARVSLPQTYEGALADRPHAWDERDRRYADWVESLHDSPYLEHPMQVSFETLARCNAACGFCPYPTLSRKGTRMPDELLDKLLGELGDIPEDLRIEVCPNRVNEPFLDRRLFDVVARINEERPNAWLVIFTNGSTLTDETLDRVERWERVERFNVSFNDHRPGEYERTMRIPYERTVANLDRLHERVDAGAIGFGVSLSRVGDQTDADRSFVEWCRVRWPRFRAITTPREDWMGLVGSRTAYPTPPMGCSQWFKLGFHADGRDVFCCIDAEGEHGSASLADMHLLEIYNLPERRARRARGLTRDRVGLCAGCQLRA
jgi:hypothetical protein